MSHPRSNKRVSTCISKFAFFQAVTFSSGTKPDIASLNCFFLPFFEVHTFMFNVMTISSSTLSPSSSVMIHRHHDLMTTMAPFTITTSWSPNSTVLHLDIYYLCKYTNLKDKAGQSATLLPWIYDICPFFYTTWFSGQKFYIVKVRYLRHCSLTSRESWLNK